VGRDGVGGSRTGALDIGGAMTSARRTATSQGNRRAFLFAVGGLVGGGRAALASPPGPGVAANRPGALEQQRPAPGKWDLAWLDGFKGRHKMVYDLHGHTPRPTSLAPPTNYFDAHEDLSGLRFPDINVVVGANRTAFPIVAGDALWAAHRLGERANIQEPDTGKPATRNVYLGPASGSQRATVRWLQERGAVFWMCHLSLRAIAADLGRELNRQADAVYDELVAGLVAGVKVVPAHTWAMGTVQERGFTYQSMN
jgi:hypothetical protein